jgi:hypothetical protein
VTPKPNIKNPFWIGFLADVRDGCDVHVPPLKESDCLSVTPTPRAARLVPCSPVVVMRYGLPLY